MRIASIYLALCAIAFAAVDLSKPIPELKLNDGRTLKNVMIVSYSSTAAMAKWDGGRGTIQYENLPKDYRDAIEKNRAPAPSVDNSAAEAAQRRRDSSSSVPSRKQTPEEIAASLPPLNRDPIAAQPEETSFGSTTVSGQCFVVTKGGTNIKMGLVEVAVYSAKNFAAYEAEISERTKARFARIDEITRSTNGKSISELDRDIKLLDIRIQEGYSVWSLLPPPSASAKTDADGKFTLTHKVKPPYVIFARAHRMAGNSEEHYRWAVHSENIPDPAQLFLSNDNMARR